MSIELLELMYLQCDQVTLEGPQCPETYPPKVRDGWVTSGSPDTWIEDLVRRANLVGWVAEVHYNGLKGVSVVAKCPNHAGS